MEWMFNEFFQYTHMYNYMINTIIDLSHNMSYASILIKKLFPIIEYSQIYEQLYYPSILKKYYVLENYFYSDLILIKITNIYLSIPNSIFYNLLYQLYTIKVITFLPLHLCGALITASRDLWIYSINPILIQMNIFINTTVFSYVYTCYHSYSIFIDTIVNIVKSIIICVMNVLQIMSNLFIKISLKVIYFIIYYVYFFFISHLCLYIFFDQKTKNVLRSILNEFSINLLNLFLFQITWNEFKIALKSFIWFFIQSLSLLIHEFIFYFYFTMRDVFYYWVDYSIEKYNIIKTPIIFIFMYFFGFWYVSTHDWFDHIRYVRYFKHKSFIDDTNKRFRVGMRVWTKKNNINYYWKKIFNVDLCKKWGSRRKYRRWSSLFSINDFFSHNKPFKKIVLLCSKWNIGAMSERWCGKFNYNRKWASHLIFNWSTKNRIYFANQKIITKVQSNRDYCRFVHTNDEYYNDMWNKSRNVRFRTLINFIPSLGRPWHMPLTASVDTKLLMSKQWWDTTSWFTINANKKQYVHRSRIPIRRRVRIPWSEWWVSFFLTPQQVYYKYGRRFFKITQVTEFKEWLLNFQCFNDIYMSKSHLKLRSFMSNIDSMIHNHYKFHREFIVSHKYIYKPITLKEKALEELKRENAKNELKTIVNKPKEIWWPHSRILKFIVWMVPDELAPNKPKFRESARAKAHIDKAIADSKWLRDFGGIPHREYYDRTAPEFQPKRWYSDLLIYSILKNELGITDYTQWRLTKFLLRIYLYIRGWIKYFIVTIYNFFYGYTMLIYKYLKIIWIIIYRIFIVFNYYFTEWYDRGQVNMEYYNRYFANQNQNYSIYYEHPNPGFKHVSLLPEMSLITLLWVSMWLFWLRTAMKFLFTPLIIKSYIILNHKYFPIYQNAVYENFKWRIMTSMEFDLQNYSNILSEMLVLKFIELNNIICIKTLNKSLLDMVITFNSRSNIIDQWVSTQYLLFSIKRNNWLLYSTKEKINPYDKIIEIKL